MSAPFPMPSLFPGEIVERGRDVVTGAELLLTKTAQVRLCGNSVCPDEAEALVTANVASVARPRRARRLADLPLFVEAAE